MKRVILVTVIILAATLVFILAQTRDVTAGSKDRVCVMHREDGKYVKKWVEPKSYDAHIRHGDNPCVRLTETAEAWTYPILYFPNMLKRLDPLMTP